jgi:hypothetical protein
VRGLCLPRRHTLTKRDDRFELDIIRLRAEDLSPACLDLIQPRLLPKLAAYAQFLDHTPHAEFSTGSFTRQALEFETALIPDAEAMFAAAVSAKPSLERTPRSMAGYIRDAVHRCFEYTTTIAATVD